METEFGDRLKDTRKRRFMTQRDLADASGLHFTTIAKLENGYVEARMRTILKLAQGLEVSPAFLAGYEE